MLFCDKFCWWYYCNIVLTWHMLMVPVPIHCIVQQNLHSLGKNSTDTSAISAAFCISDPSQTLMDIWIKWPTKHLDCYCLNLKAELVAYFLIPIIQSNGREDMLLQVKARGDIFTVSNNSCLHAWLTARLSCFVVSDEKSDKNERDGVIDQSTSSTGFS